MAHFYAIVFFFLGLPNRPFLVLVLGLEAYKVEHEVCRATANKYIMTDRKYDEMDLKHGITYMTKLLLWVL